LPALVGGGRARRLPVQQARDPPRFLHHLRHQVLRTRDRARRLADGRRERALPRRGRRRRAEASALRRQIRLSPEAATFGRPVPRMLEGSQRLVYRRLTGADLDAFHRLAVDPHVRRHLLDGQVMSREWADAEITGSEALFAEAKVGLWLAASGSDTLGFCGFRRYDELTPEPQLLYALRGDHAGRGLATGMAQALLGHVRSLGWERVVAAVDEPNVASRRVLEKTGFTRCGSLPGAFGEILLFERFEGPAPQRLSCPSGSRMELAVASTW